MKNVLIILLCIISICNVLGQNKTSADSKKQFEKLSNLKWHAVLYDSCTEDWNQHWFLDGKKAEISHSENGMDFWAGPIRQEDASHAVLWTKQSFEGDIRLDFEYTKLDDTNEAVTILYIQATGSGADEYEKDISKWVDKRDIPAMKEYFNNMNLLHLSYAAFGINNDDKQSDYIRARRYMPIQNNGLKNTELEPSYFETGFFKKDIPYNVTVIKKGNDLFMHIKNKEKEFLCHWGIDSFPQVTEGRIGLRHMWTRAARYNNFRISQLCSD